MSSTSDKKGLVLVAVLWLMVVLMAMVATVGRNSRLDAKVSHLRMEELHCKWACRAGIEKAIAVLYEDLRESDCLTDLWSDNAEDFNDIVMEGCVFTVQVVDEASKLNINTATREQLLALPDMVEDMADAIIDWRDSDDTPRSGGAEAGYYEDLQFPYRTGNGPFMTLRELLLVRDVTDELFFGEDTNFNGRLDYNERDGDASPPHDDQDSEIDPGWIAYLTCYSYDNNTDASGNARVNINDADEGELQDSLGISRAQATWIVENRPNNGYESIADLINDDSPSQSQASSGGNSDGGQAMDLQTFSEIADQITVSDEQKVPGRVNVNTASEEVLIALLGGSDTAVTAQNIIAYRENLLYGIQSIGELLQTVSIDEFKRIANFITTRSDVYNICCVATADRAGSDGLSLLTEAVVDRSSSPYEILYWYQGAGN
jgi:general secretion pathway protein K